MKYALTLVTAIIISATMVCGQEQERPAERHQGREGGGDFRQRMQDRMKAGREGAERPGGEERGKGGKPGGREDMMERLLSNPEMREKLGISEEEAEEIKNELHELKVKYIDLKAEMEKLSLEQARAMTSKEIDEDEVMDLVEEIGELRTEIAKIQIQKMMIFRKSIDPEKMAEIKKGMHERMRGDREGGFERRKPGGGDMRKRGPGGEDRDREEQPEE